MVLDLLFQGLDALLKHSEVVLAGEVVGLYLRCAGIVIAGGVVIAGRVVIVTGALPFVAGTLGGLRGSSGSRQQRADQGE
jgi:hypothetical protein